PQISTLIDVRGQNGYFVSGLPENAATVFEDEQPIQASITEARPGAQIVVAFTGGDSFGVINLNLQTRYDVIKTWLMNWADSLVETDVDDLSFIVPEGIVVSHATDPQQLADGLENYQPNFGTVVNPVEILSAAIDLALDPTPKEGMGRTVVFITGGISDDQQDALLSQIARASQAGIRLQIGLVNSTNFFSGNQAIQLQSAAQQTDGQYFAYSSEEVLPDLNILLEASRRVYVLEYRSMLTTSGTHTIQVMVNSDIGEILSEPKQFDATIAPPTPVFVSPPAQIIRAIPEDARNQPENLAPNIQTVDVLIEFPDGYTREITSLGLYVNNVLTAETSEPPFAQLTFDLTPYQTDETLNLRLEATDELGLTGSSIEIPVDITIETGHSSIIPGLSSNAPLIIGGVIAFTAVILFLVLVIAGRIRPRKMGERRQKRQARQDPVTQPIKRKLKAKTKREEQSAQQAKIMERISQRISTPRIQWPSRTRPTTDPYGTLVRVAEDGEPMKEGTFLLTMNELTFGADPKQAVLTLNHPCVEPLHARLWRTDEGLFYLEDSGSVAGTYVNYAQVAANGTLLHHGDLIHIGKIAYRFNLSQPKQVRKPVVTNIEEPPEKDEA
ncbi:MAG: FHA domain-containing protein, partial [Anaerolineales bacterium]